MLAIMGVFTAWAAVFAAGADARVGAASRALLGDCHVGVRRRP